MEPKSTRDHLIDVGLEQIHKTSYAATGVKEILSLASVPKGSFYHHFSSKEAFVKEVLGRYIEIETARAQKTLLTSKGAPLKRLRKYFDELISVYGPLGTAGGGCLFGNLSLEMADHSDLVQQLLHEGFKSWQIEIETVLNEAIVAGDLSDRVKSKETAAFILNSYEGAMLRARAERSREPLRMFLQIIFGTFLVP